MWTVERWIKPKRDRDRRITQPGHWFAQGIMDEQAAEKTVRALASAGNVARATRGDDEMVCYPELPWRQVTFYRLRATTASATLPTIAAPR